MIQIQTLLQQLKHFGLNPRDWWISPAVDSAHHWLLQNKKDREFQFVGETLEANRQLRWQSLFLISI